MERSFKSEFQFDSYEDDLDQAPSSRRSKLARQERDVNADADDASSSSSSSGDENSDQVEAELLGQLQELHRQLGEVRKAGASQHSGRRMFETRQKLIICAPRKPVIVSPGGDGLTWAYEESVGGFKTAVDSLMGSNRVWWVSWPGCAVDGPSRAGMRKKLETDYNTVPVFLSEEVADLWHNAFCQGVLWPLFHCVPSNFNDGLLDNFQGQVEAYTRANQVFRDTVAEIYEEGDLVLVFDYTLLLLPALLRKRYPEITCGFFLHCPFPSTEFYRMLPVRKELLQGILGADLVSFNAFDYVECFLNSCTRILGLESYPSRIEYGGRLISVSICPMGINPDDFDLGVQERAILAQLKATHRTGDGVRKTIVSIDRLDLCKGIPLKLLAMESLLERYPHWRGRVMMFAVVRDRGRKGDRPLRKAVDALVGRVNGKFGYADYCPIHYIKKNLTRTEIIALNAMGDVCLVSSIREGINLSAMEFIACQQEMRLGVLVYSEFAGCAPSFKGAILVNPNDPDKVADGVNAALIMPEMTKKIRHHQLSRYVNHYTAGLWARRMVLGLQQAGHKAREYNNLQKLDLGYLRSFYSRSRRRLILLDYDGTLVQHCSISQLGEPSAAVLSTLEQLVDDPSNTVYIISGRRREDLERWLGCIVGLGLVAEWGYWVKPAWAHGGDSLEVAGERPLRSFSSAFRPSPPKMMPKDKSLSMHTIQSAPPATQSSDRRTFTADIDFDLIGMNPQGLDWQCCGGGADLSWREDVLKILQSYTNQTPGSCLELKDCGLTWHFRDADADFGLTQAKNLQLHFDQMLQNQNVRVIMAPINKYIVIQPARVNKGRAISRILHQEVKLFDLILGIGDERTDEDMFDVLQGSQCFTCTVGKKISKAQYYVETWQAVLPILHALAHNPGATMATRRASGSIHSATTTPVASRKMPSMGLFSSVPG
jgi:trehalose 6-phosphate synthase/phosphatase